MSCIPGWYLLDQGTLPLLHPKRNKKKALRKSIGFRTLEKGSMIVVGSVLVLAWRLVGWEVEVQSIIKSLTSFSSNASKLAEGTNALSQNIAKVSYWNCGEENTRNLVCEINYFIRFVKKLTLKFFFFIFFPSFCELTQVTTHNHKNERKTRNSRITEFFTVFGHCFRFWGLFEHFLGRFLTANLSITHPNNFF